MITDSLLSFVLEIFDFIFAKFPSVYDVEISASFFEPALDVIESILYFFPMQSLCAIVWLVWTFWGIRITIRVVRTVWDLLPVL